MKRVLLLTLSMFAVAIFAFSCTSGTEKSAITYTTTDNQPLDKKFGTVAFDANITEHTYENGTGRIVFDKTITRIGNYAFQCCARLTSVTIPDSVTSIGGAAFYKCSNLTSVYCKPKTPPTLKSSNGFYGISSYAKIYVPRASVKAYKSAENWSDYASRIVGYDF